MKRIEAKKLLVKYSHGLCTDEEKAIVESFYNNYKPSEEYDLNENELTSSLERIRETLPVQKQKPLIIPWLRIASAAAILIFISTGIWFYLDGNNNKATQIAKNKTEHDRAPGSNKAILTLSDGKKISLTDVNNGLIAEQSGVKITKTAEGQIIYALMGPGAKIPNGGYHTISTPRGGQYQVNLPDGTKVWLNAASSLTYPANFASFKQRRIELSGEAYFEVAHNKANPFRVFTDKQEVEVLGTHFNITNYKDEPDTRTTLIEGSVKVNSASGNIILQPGQQAILLNTPVQIKVQKADLETTMAWKYGTFQFKGETIESIMRKLSRWYDVEIVYQGNYTKQGFVGTISRFENISGVLRMLELTGTVHFKVEGRKITVMP